MRARILVLALALALSSLGEAGAAVRPVEGGKAAPAAKRAPLRGPERPASPPAGKSAPLRVAAAYVPTPAAPAVDPSACRLACAQTYYFCLAGSAADACPSDWTRCLAGCGESRISP
jgi:hypothetical protein